MRAEKVKYCITCGGKLVILIKPTSTLRTVWACKKCGDRFRRVTALQKLDGDY